MIYKKFKIQKRFPLSKNQSCGRKKKKSVFDFGVTILETFQRSHILGIKASPLTLPSSNP